MSSKKKNNKKKAYIYAFHVGKIEAWSISDGWGTFGKCVSKKMWPPAQRPEMTKALTDLGERPDDVTLYINVLVLRLGKEVVLVDAGFAVSLVLTRPEARGLLARLAVIYRHTTPRHGEGGKGEA